MSNASFPGVTTKQVCERTGLHNSTISRMVKEGRITPIYRLAPGMGGAMFFAEEDVQRLEDEVKAAS